MSESEKRIAVLIDADNAPASKVDEILAEVARHGVANVRRAYGNWKSSNLKQWEAVLHEYAIRPIQQFAYSKGKNASDMAMVVDAMDLLYGGRLDGFALVSSDADFTPLVMRLLTDGVKVYGFGERKTPLPFVNACSQFTYVEALGDGTADGVAPPAGDGRPATAQDAAVPAIAPAPAPTPGPQLRGDTRLVNLLRGAVEASADDHGWAGLRWVRWSTKSPTVPRWTRATTVTASGWIWCQPSACSRCVARSWRCMCVTVATRSTAAGGAAGSRPQ